VHDPRIGVDLGGTKIEAAALDAQGRVTHRRRTATPAGSYAATLGAIVELVRAVEAELGARAAVGIATPGARSLVDGRMKNANSTCLNGQPLKEDLERALGREIRMANDANCFALSEAIDGAGRGARSVFGVIIGTGVGGGIVVDGRVLTGENGAATEWSHTTLPFLSPGEHAPYACFCKRADCIESFTSGRALIAWYRALGGDDADGTAIGSRAAAGGDAAAGRAFALYEEALARALASVVNMIDPRAIVLGGGVSNNPRIFENVPKLWERWTVPKDLRTKLVRAAHGDASGVRGAALLW